MTIEWQKTEVWKHHGSGYCVEITRHEVPPSHGEGPHRWCVYAYIYPDHPHYAKFDGHDMCQDAATALPLHWGPSLLQHYIDSETGKPTSVKVGADYNHLHDDLFTHCATPEQARLVFEDADELVDWLERLQQEPQP